MDELNLKAEKPNAIRTHNILGAICKTLRIVELCLAILLLSWILTRLPFAVTISAEYLRTLSAFAASPLFVFALSNAIIAALLAQSGSFAAQHSASPDADAGLYLEFLNNRDRDRPQSEDDVPPPPPAEAVEYQDKQVISVTVPDSGAGAASDIANYRRSQSEKWKGKTEKVPPRRELRRSETEKKRREYPPENLYPQDKLSNEEFQRAIEAFIAKQIRFLREENPSQI
ncbi:uncharacterized protein LOC133301956 [Gastrolobium bilobum]|uniref:uncharacterized protein LOC133301956 n=1 Tax=Gastrolobium bilobum TaxID=150636 RepID=UPI002AB25E6A|nr:uncharacterized protein LOC133301956 [Gastrolobium bilobum]